jgi:hypothetical protein
MWLVVDEVVNSLALAAEIFFCLRWTLLDSETGVGTGLVTGELFAELFTRGPVRADESGPTVSPPLEWPERGVVVDDAVPSARGRTMLAGTVKFDVDGVGLATTRVKDLIGFPPRLDGMNELDCEKLL